MDANNVKSSKRMIVKYRIENSEYFAHFTDKEGFKTKFGPFPRKINMIMSIYEYFKNKGRFQLKKESDLTINGIDYGEKLDKLSIKLKYNIYRLSFMDVFYYAKTYGMILMNPMDENLIIRNYD